MEVLTVCTILNESTRGRQYTANAEVAFSDFKPQYSEVSSRCLTNCCIFDPYEITKG